MPYKSDAQRRFMHAQHPGIAKRWDAHTPKGTELPEHVGGRQNRTPRGAGGWGQWGGYQATPILREKQTRG